jgi:hypothetical protein
MVFDPVLLRPLPEVSTACARTSPPFLRSTRTSGRCSARPGPHRFRHTDPMTAGLTLSHAPHHPWDICTLCGERRPRLWIPTLGTP